MHFTVEPRQMSPGGARAVIMPPRLRRPPRPPPDSADRTRRGWRGASMSENQTTMAPQAEGQVPEFLTRSEAIARHLREEIVTGQLGPGTVIKDAELADRLGVSITPVREAIVLLSAEGLIDISPNRTRRVTDVSQKNALELIDVMCVLACAGVEWGVPNLTGADPGQQEDLVVHGQAEHDGEDEHRDVGRDRQRGVHADQARPPAPLEDRHDHAVGGADREQV